MDLGVVYLDLDVVGRRRCLQFLFRSGSKFGDSVTEVEEVEQRGRGFPFFFWEKCEERRISVLEFSQKVLWKPLILLYELGMKKYLKLKMRVVGEESYFTTTIQTRYLLLLYF